MTFFFHLKEVVDLYHVGFDLIQERLDVRSDAFGPFKVPTVAPTLEHKDLRSCPFLLRQA